MKYAIVYSSQTGNTKMLADTIRRELPEEDCVYFGRPDTAALEAERIYVGFWTNRGTCDEETAAFLKQIKGGEVYLFGTAGFGGKPEYFDTVLKKTEEKIREGVKLIGSFMCQGKMPPAVRERYEKMQSSGAKVPNIKALIENFDKALTHPDPEDLEALGKAVRA